MYHRRRHRSSSNPAPPSPSALIAANTAYQPSAAAAAAAGAALRNASVTPVPMERRTGSIPTKRMLERRGSYSSVTSNEGGVTVSSSNGMIERRTSFLTHRFRFEKSHREGRYWESDDEEDAGVGIGRVGSTRSNTSRRSMKMTLRSPPESPSRGKKGKGKSGANVLSRGSIRGASAPDLRVRRKFSMDSDISVITKPPPVPPLPQDVPITRVIAGDGYADSVASFASELESIAEDEGENGSAVVRRRRKRVGKVPGDEGVRVEGEEIMRRSRVPETPDSHSGGAKRTEMPMNTGLVPPTPPSSTGGLRVKSRPSSSSSASSAIGLQAIKTPNHSSGPHPHFGLTPDPTIHTPPPRSISPGKSALKRPSTPEHKNPDSSSSTSSSIVHPWDKEKNKKPRVSFSSEDSVAVENDITSKPKLWDLDGDAPGGVKISKLPTFTSIGKRPWEEEKTKTRDEPVLIEVDGSGSSLEPEDVEFDWERKRKEVSTPITGDVVPPTSAVKPRNGCCFTDPNEPIPEVPTPNMVEATPAEEQSKKLESGYMNSPLAKRTETAEEASAGPVEYPSDDESGASIYSDAVEEFDPVGSAEGGGVVLNPMPQTNKSLPSIMEVVADAKNINLPGPPQSKGQELPRQPLPSESLPAEIIPSQDGQDEIILTPPSPTLDRNPPPRVPTPFPPPQETIPTSPPTPPPVFPSKITSLPPLHRTPSASSVDSKTSISSYKRTNPRPQKSNNGLRASMRSPPPSSEPALTTHHSMKQTLRSYPPPPSPSKVPFRTLSRRSTASSSDDTPHPLNRSEIFRKPSITTTDHRPATATATTTTTTHATGAFSLPLGVNKRGLLRRNSNKDHEKPPSSFRMPRVGRNTSLLRKKRDSSLPRSENPPSTASSTNAPSAEAPPVPPVPSDREDAQSKSAWRRPSLRKKKRTPDSSLTNSHSNSNSEGSKKSGETTPSPMSIGIAVSPGVGGVDANGNVHVSGGGEVIVEGGVGIGVAAQTSGKKKKFRILRRLFGLDD